MALIKIQNEITIFPAQRKIKLYNSSAGGLWRRATIYMVYSSSTLN